MANPEDVILRVDNKEAEIYFFLLNDANQEKLSQWVSLMLSRVFAEGKIVANLVLLAEFKYLTNFVDVLFEIARKHEAVELEMLNGFLSRLSTIDLVSLWEFVDRESDVEVSFVVNVIKDAIEEAIKNG
jgi:hypothetical protein